MEERCLWGEGWGEKDGRWNGGEGERMEERQLHGVERAREKEGTGYRGQMDGRSQGEEDERWNRGWRCRWEERKRRMERADGKRDGGRWKQKKIEGERGGKERRDGVRDTKNGIVRVGRKNERHRKTLATVAFVLF